MFNLCWRFLTVLGSEKVIWGNTNILSPLFFMGLFPLSLPPTPPSGNDLRSCSKFVFTTAVGCSTPMSASKNQSTVCVIWSLLVASEDFCSVVLGSFRLNGSAQRLHLGRVVEDKGPPVYDACMLALWRVQDTVPCAGICCSFPFALRNHGRSLFIPALPLTSFCRVYLLPCFRLPGLQTQTQTSAGLNNVKTVMTCGFGGIPVPVSVSNGT